MNRVPPNHKKMASRSCGLAKNDICDAWISTSQRPMQAR
jgi:hypothetical protein